MAKEKKELNTDDMTDEELKQAAADQLKDEKDDLFSEDPKKTDDDETTPTSGEKAEGKELSLDDRFANLEKSYAELEKVNKGLYGSMKAEREERQDLSGRLEGITQVFSESLGKRGEKTEDPEADKAGKLSVDRLKVEVDDDGNAFIPVDDSLRNLIAAQNSGSSKEELEELKHEVSQDRAFRESEKAFEDQKRAIIGEDPAYAPAFEQIDKAYQWFNGRLVEFQKENRIPGFVSTGDALDIAVEEDFESEFKKEFPTLDMVKTARMYDGKSDFKRSLKSAVATDDKKTGGKSATSNLKDIAGKASNLSNLRNQRGSQGSLTLDEVAERADEIPNMTDEQIEKLHRLMKREEEAA